MSVLDEVLLRANFGRSLPWPAFTAAVPSAVTPPTPARAPQRRRGDFLLA